MGRQACFEKSIPRVAYSLILSVGLIGAAEARLFDGALSLNKENFFGTVALVPKAIRKGQFARINQYEVVPNDGQIKLSGQSGYCFIVTHFDPENAGRLLKYEFRTTAVVDNEIRTIDPGKSKSLPITNNNASTRFPSYCMFARESGTVMTISVRIKIGSQALQRSFNVEFD